MKIFGHRVPSPLPLQIPRTSISESEAHQLLELEKDESITLVRKEHSPYIFDGVMVECGLLSKFLGDAGAGKGFGSLPGSTGIDGALLAGLLSLTSWAKVATRMDQESPDYIATDLIKYGSEISEFGTQLELAGALNVPISTVERGIKFLKYAGVIISVRPGFILLNPLIVWKGKHRHRVATIEALTAHGVELRRDSDSFGNDRTSSFGPQHARENPHDDD